MKRSTFFLLGMAVFTACSDGSGISDPVASRAGTLTVRWTTPAGVDGAVQLTIRGPDVGNVVSASDSWLSFSRPVEGGRAVVVFGTLASGDLVTFGVPDVTRAAAYHVEIHDVADGDGHMRAGVSSYNATVGLTSAQ